jgi:hypothetical protein
LITSNSHLSFIYYAIEACTILAGRMVARIIHISHTTLTNPGKTYHTCIAPHFLSVFLFFFFAVYRSGAFGWIDAAQVSKKRISRTLIQHRRRPRRRARWTLLLSCSVASLLYVSHCTVSLYLSLAWSTFNRALFLPT